MRRELMVLAVGITGIFAACEKSIQEPLLEKSGSFVPKNRISSNFSYGTDELYIKEGVNTVSPVKVPASSVRFRAIPSGLAINRRTGAIDVSKSLTGMAYKVYAISSTGVLIDSTRIVVSGLDYEDGIYRKEDNNGTLRAIYNANKNASIPLVQGSLEEFVEVVACDLNADGINDRIPNVIKTRVGLNSRDGSFNLNEFIQGPLWERMGLPSGAMIEFSFKYKMNDKSNRSENRTTVRIFYFKKESDIPANIKNTLKEREALSRRINTMPVPGSSGSGVNEGDPATEDDLDAFAKPIRPPLVIII